jgi:hypothetical protein
MIRRDERSRLVVRAQSAGASFTHPFRAPSLTYRELAMPPGAFAASRSPRNRRARPKEVIREELRVAVWESEGGMAGKR